MSKRRVFWYLKDANGLTVASGDGPDDHYVRNDARHYLMMYSQDGPHKLSFRRAPKRKPTRKRGK